MSDSQVLSAPTATRPPFIESLAVKKLLINGQWVPPLAGRSFESINPSTGDVLAHIAEGDASDIDAAVAAARHTSA